MIKYKGALLHYAFVCALLNDLFGIQARGGCMCAGPYTNYLMGISNDLAESIKDNLNGRYDVLRPGFARVNFPYFATDDEVQCVIDAVAWVSVHGWKMLADYMFDVDTGAFCHLSDRKFKSRRWIGDLYFNEKAEVVYSKLAEEAAHQTAVVEAGNGLDSAQLFASADAAVADVVARVQ